MNIMLKRLIRQIKNLNIQGASDILLATQKFFYNYIEKNHNLSKKELKSMILQLWNLRPNEPALKNFLVHFYLKYDLLESKYSKLGFIHKYKKDFLNRKKLAIKNFVNMINEKSIFITHCHSSLVESSLIELNKKGLVKFVINSETRPLFQGRITSKNLAHNDVKVKHIVDGGHVGLIQDILEKKKENILFITGADVITKDGDIINKIGTSQINFALNDFNIKHFVISTSDKIDMVSQRIYLNSIEKRNPNEIWKIKNKNIEVLNYAFDITRAKNVFKIITDEKSFEPIYIKNFLVLNKKFNKTWEEFQNGD